MLLASPLASPFAEGGGGSSALVPGLYDVAIAGRPYMIDWKYAASENFTRESIALLKPQQDNSGKISEQSLNPADFARSGQESWHQGAGQSHADRADSEDARFRSSKGIMPWERWEFSLLNDTAQQTASANTNLQVLSAGAFLYEVDGNQVYHRATLAGARTDAVIHNGEAAQSVKSIATNGTLVYAALGSNGIHQTTAGAATSSHYSDLSCTLIGYEKGRLMAANGAAIYNVIAAGAAPAALYTHPNASFSWVGFASGLGVLYAAGYSGDLSLVYKTAVLADGTALAVPTVAGQLPDGEIIRSIQGYLGFVLLGTDQGVRFATADANGNLTIGALIDLGVSVRCFEGQDRFVWFGWSNFDGTSTGLGRLDLTTINESAPAYASDLMATGQGTVLSVCTFADKRVFAVSGLGTYRETSTLVASGTLDGGLISFGLPVPKIAASVDVRHEPLDGTLAVSLSTDGGAFADLGSSSLADSTALVLAGANATGETFELRYTLTRAADTVSGPVVTRTTVEANPVPGRGLYFLVPLLMWDEVELANGKPATMDTAAEEAALIAMQVHGLAVTVQTGANTEQMLLDDLRFILEQYNQRRDGWCGTMLCRFKRPRVRG